LGRILNCTFGFGICGFSDVSVLHFGKDSLSHFQLLAFVDFPMFHFCILGRIYYPTFWFGICGFSDIQLLLLGWIWHVHLSFVVGWLVIWFLGSGFMLFDGDYVSTN
jgi:hypothetical protein